MRRTALLTARLRPSGSIIYSYTGGNQFWLCPPDTYWFRVDAWGAGGSGGPRYQSSNDYGGGGGGGAYAWGIIQCTPGQNYTVVVGAGGVNDNEFLDGSSGGQSIVDGDFNDVYAYGGGGGGRGINNGAPGAAGLYNNQGAPNGSGVSGSAGISGGNGGLGTGGANNGPEGGLGGTSGGSPAGVPGGGGAGGRNTSNALGLPGGHGKIVITWPGFP